MVLKDGQARSRLDLLSFEGQEGLLGLVNTVEHVWLKDDLF